MDRITLAEGDSHPQVRDLRRRLRDLGLAVDGDSEMMDGSLVAAVRTFQDSRGLEVDGVCGPGTWRVLLEAEFRMGTRLLSLTRPMLRGDDVSELQHRLGNLGFDPGRIDGIFGPDTERAVAEFQRNAGLVVDQVCGPDTVEALERIATRGGTSSVTGLKEREHFRNSSRDLIGMRIAICAMDDSDPIAGPLGSGLQLEGADVAVFADPDGSRLAQMANGFGADLCVGLVVTVLPACDVAYFGVDNYTSPAGHALAELVVRNLPTHPGLAPAETIPMRIPLLRETKATAIRVKIGPAATVYDTTALIASGIQRAVDRWAQGPVTSTATSTST